MPEQIFINDRSTIEAIMLAHVAAGYGFRLPLYEAARDQKLALVEVTAGGEVLLEGLTDDRPAIVVLGDDGTAPQGPKGFAQAATVLRWTAAVMLHATGGEEVHYRTAVKLACEYGRALLIETDGERRNAWIDVIFKEMQARKRDGRPQFLVIDIRAPGQAPHPMEVRADG